MQKNADISQIKDVLALKGIFSETKYVCVLRYQFQVSTIFLTRFRQGDFTQPPTSSKRKPKKLNQVRIKASTRLLQIQKKSTV